MTILQEHSWHRAIRTTKRLFRHAPLATGVDVGSRMIKTVVLQADREGLSLTDFSMQSVGEMANSDEQAFSQLVASIRAKMIVPFTRIGTALSGPSVFVKSLNLPFLMTEENLREHLTLELDRYIACDVQDVFWDVCALHPLSKMVNDQHEYFLVVAQKECVERHMDAFAQCGVIVQFIDADAFALVNLVTYNYGQEGSWLLAHMGPTGVVMVVMTGGQPAYIRKAGYEADWYGDFLEQVLLPTSLLEARKELGASESLLLEQFFQEMYRQICETLESFSDLSITEISRGILLSGGYAVAPEMASTFARSLKMPVHVLDPFQAITVPSAIQQDPVFAQRAPLMSVAVGVALRGALCHA